MEARRSPRLHGWFLFLAVLCVCVAVAGGWWYLRPRAVAPTTAGGASTSPQAPTAATYVGEPACTKCHEGQAKEWRLSDHARAMDLATEATVLGDFANASFTYAGITSSFYRRGSTFFVRTDGPDGAVHDYEIKYVFGYKPLQQYLVEFPGGRLQCLGIAWDTRPASQGGQRWYHLYPGQKVLKGDPLHWTGPNQNWNYMCADCHSTNLRRNYDAATDTYKTTWSEINVSCETCHGPGSAHVTWAEDRKKRGLTGRDSTPMGLLVQGLRAMDYSGFGVGDATRVEARLADRPRQRAEIQVCAPCHSRRGPITDVPDYGKTFLDSYRPALLDEGLYYADGQMLEEDYEYASFTQSKMYQAGVTCSDCHNAHSLKQRGTGNNVCLHCHLPLNYDTVNHHHHKPDTDAALCRNCHMRSTTYMVVDPRYDHSIRVPRVDYSIAYGIPNACTTPCHAAKGFAWANDAIVKWYGPTRTRGNDYVAALAAARHHEPGAEQALRAAVLNKQFPPVARATALDALGSLLSPASMDALDAGLHDPDALLRATAARTLEQAPPEDRWRLGSALLRDPVRLVRAWAAVSLAATPPSMPAAEESAQLERATKEAIALENAVGERPESHVNLANLYMQQGRLPEAEAELNIALKLDARHVPALVNLADLCRETGRESDAERYLKSAITIAPDASEPVHALGLVYIRTKRLAEAGPTLKRAYQLNPAAGRYGYVYAVFLDSQGRTAEAVTVLSNVQHVRQADREVLTLLANYEAKLGHWQAANGWAQKLVDLRPEDAEARALLARMTRESARAPRQR